MNKHLIYTLCLEVFFHLFFFKQRTWKYFVNDSYLLRIYKPKRRRRRPLVWGAGHSLPYPISNEGTQWLRSCEYQNELKTGSECQFSQLLLSRRPLTKAASKMERKRSFSILLPSTSLYYFLVRTPQEASWKGEMVFQKPLLPCWRMEGHVCS